MAPPESQNGDASASMLKDRRFKLSRACDRCRRRRIRCDEGHPCQACITSASACTFEEPGKRTHSHKSKKTASLEDRMHQLESLIQAIPPAVFAANGLSNFAAILNPADATVSASMASSSHKYPSSVPPPSLNTFPLINPSTHFPSSNSETCTSPNTTFHSLSNPINGTSSFRGPSSPVEQLSDEASRLSLSPSYLYLDDEGYTRWQGQTSGLPILDLLVERHSSSVNRHDYKADGQNWKKPLPENWFPDRTPRKTDVNPETMWRLVTSFIVPELMDSLVQCYLSTSYYIMPFLHVPSFLADYGNPKKWGEPGFAAFIVAVCCLASRHIDDPRVRADPEDGNSAGTQWFELFGKLRAVPSADRPTVYTVQAVLIAGIYAIGLGKLSKAFALLSESITLSVDTGLHRTSEAYDCFDPIEDEVRKRTFFSVYLWDKQASAHFGRPPMIRMRDCDVGEPAAVDDEFITRDGVGIQPPGTASRMSAFMSVIRVFVVMESVLDVPPSKHLGESSPFLARAANILSGFKRHKELREEEALLDEIVLTVPHHWAHTVEAMSSDDVIRVTQSERFHCAEQFVRMLIYRHRFSELVAERCYGADDEQTEAERDAIKAAHGCTMQIIAAHLHIAAKGLMTYYGVHVIHQLTQAGRTIIAILLNCTSEPLRYLIPTSLNALRSCVALLRQFSGRYVCGLRSCDLLEEFCRVTQVPLETARRQESPESKTPRLPWIRPVRKKTPSVPRSNHSSSDSRHTSPEEFSPANVFIDMTSAVSDAQKSPSTKHHVSSMSDGQNSPQAQFSNMMSQPLFTDNSPSLELPMSPGDIAALFNDDMTSIFGPSLSPGFLDNQNGLQQSDDWAMLHRH